VGLGLIDGSAGFGLTDVLIAVLSVAGILLASVNIFGGFTVTGRMLKMFRKG
jgi:NAD(P) transhydrogenase subunit alpha